MGQPVDSSRFHPGQIVKKAPEMKVQLSVNKLLTIDYITSLRSKPGKPHSTNLACHAILTIIDKINWHGLIFFHRVSLEEQ